MNKTTGNIFIELRCLCDIRLFAIFILILFCSCANQLPPSGGEDDRISPKILSIIPKQNSVNFHGRSIKIKFDEYVDRRSFEESFFISPKPKGETSFDWSGKEVEVEFSKPLDKNRTYVVIIGKEVKDIRGGNPLEESISFAFSTGNKIDQGKISGRVFAENYERVKVLLYIADGKSSDSLNPEKNIPDYIIPVSETGTFELTNLPEGSYRLFAIIDEDRNNLFDKEVDKISILPSDYIISKDNLQIMNLNFLLKGFETDKNGKDFLKLLKPDSLNFIYSNIKEGETDITPDYRFYFYFKNNEIPKSEIVNNFSVTDSLSGKSFRTVFNWISDSLVEIFPAEKFPFSSQLKIEIDLTETSKKYKFTASIKTASRNSFGKVSGKVTLPNEKENDKTYVRLYNKQNLFIAYSQRLKDSLSFTFDQVLEGEYILFSFIDLNDNNVPDSGNYFPFQNSENYILYEKDIKVKGGWTLDNIFLKY